MEVTFPSWMAAKVSRLVPDGNRAAGDWLTGVDVKHILGFEWERSALTGVGLIRLDGLLLFVKPEAALMGGNSSKLLRFS